MSPFGIIRPRCVNLEGNSEKIREIEENTNMILYFKYEISIDAVKMIWDSAYCW